MHKNEIAIEILFDYKHVDRSFVSNISSLVLQNLRDIVKYYAPLKKFSVRTYELSDYAEGYDPPYSVLFRLFLFDDNVDLDLLISHIRTSGALTNLCCVSINNLSSDSGNEISEIVNRHQARFIYTNDWGSSHLFQSIISNINNELERKSADIFEKESESQDLQLDPKTISDVADQLDFAIDAISELRLNTTYDIIRSLQNASSLLRIKARPTEQPAASDIKSIIEQIIFLSSKLLDAMENKKFAGLAVCGIVGSVIGLIGTPAITATALCMAYAQGPEFVKNYLMNSISLAKFKDKHSKTDAEIDTMPKPRRRRTRYKAPEQTA